ncbi:hypothetical protein [Cylindrospermopsis raciborskii]|jgi:hypothetical protein|uniref:hypothetical protein n=1 Tax=Cylindrospermopsis raciborskii TaxID=77022 RepID=UPI000E1F3913|nr:hypothetical protein [Cylindrospermopsis raciborskii]UJL33248.1 hypothetical protein C6N34_014295 [Cylindrospermopsis raciborskii Cr2010]
MSANLQLQELAISINAKDLNPAVVNPDFLKYTGIIPSEWELAKQPVYNNGVLQILFNTGLGIFVHPNGVTMVENLSQKPQEEIEVSNITHKLVEKLSQVEYKQVGINPRGFVLFNSEADAYKYIHSRLLAPGPWQEFGGKRVGASLQLSYPLERGVLNLSINQATVQFPDKVVGAILFSGNFNYPLLGNSPSQKIQDLQQIVANWHDSFNIFEQLLIEKFLNFTDATANVSVFPSALPV